MSARPANPTPFSSAVATRSATAPGARTTDPHGSQRLPAGLQFPKAGINPRREMPVARASVEMPPYSNASASAAAHKRRCRSFNNLLTRLNRRRSVLPCICSHGKRYPIYLKLVTLISGQFLSNTAVRRRRKRTRAVAGTRLAAWGSRRDGQVGPGDPRAVQAKYLRRRKGRDWTLYNGLRDGLAGRRARALVHHIRPPM